MLATEVIYAFVMAAYLRTEYGSGRLIFSNNLI